MTGIYLITNKVNSKKYVGQSVDINRRWNEHLRAGQPEKYQPKNDRDTGTPIHLAMQKYGVTNFTLEVLEECDRNQLDDNERKWIAYYQSNSKEKGYNITQGGQETIGAKGEYHSQAKLTQKEVDEIKLLLKGTNLSYDEILKYYPSITKPNLSMINQGKIWYDEKEHYPLRHTTSARIGSQNGMAKFTEEQVMEIRTKHSKGMKLAELSKEYSHIASENAVKAIIYGQTYKHLPYWSNKKKQWIEPCIDYPQS